MNSLSTLLGIRRTVNIWDARVDAELGAAHGIGPSDFSALYHLAQAPGGRLRRVDLAHRLALTPSGVTRLLAPLERRGLVSREADGNDARATYSLLTRSGKTLVNDATVTMTALADSVFRSLNERDRTAFEKLAVL
jgi:DNA-binding MarR family transcriptional regulator